MKNFMIIPLLFTCLITSAQNSRVVIYAEEGENFTLFINGQKFNEEPKSRVVANGLNMEFAQIKVEFDIPGAPVVKSPMLLESGMQHSASIKKNKKGKYVLRVVSIDPIPEEPVESGRISVVEATQPVQQNAPSPSTTTTTTTTSPSAGPNDSESFGFNVSVGGETLSMKVNMGETDGQQDVSIQTAETTSQTSYSSTTSSSGGISARIDGDKIILSDGRVLTIRRDRYHLSFTSAVEMLAPSGAKVSVDYDGLELKNSEVPFFYEDKGSRRSGGYFTFTVNEMSGVSWKVKLKLRNAEKVTIEQADGNVATSELVTTTVTQSPSNQNTCTPMSNGNYLKAKTSIEEKVFPEEQLTVFKQVIRSNCVSVDQVIGFMQVFLYEEEKLEVAKLAYPRTSDKANYYQVNDAFTYPDSIEELEAFLEKQ